jgi:hypothetical protein
MVSSPVPLESGRCRNLTPNLHLADLIQEDLDRLRNAEALA